MSGRQPQSPRRKATAVAVFLQNSTIVRFCPIAASARLPLDSLASDTDDAPPADAAAPKALMKGRQTRAAILDAALALASHIGLEGLSIGALAEVTGMSKSGVFAHFGSREELQISVVREYHAKFEEEVFRPAMAAPRGLPRLRALFERWLKRVSVEIDSGCIYISGAVEFDDRPGPGARRAGRHGATPGSRRSSARSRAAVAEGHLRADTDAAPAAVRDPRADSRPASRRPLPAPRRRRGRAARAGFERVLAHWTAPGTHACPPSDSFPGDFHAFIHAAACATCSS